MQPRFTLLYCCLFAICMTVFGIQFEHYTISSGDGSNNLTNTSSIDFDYRSLAQTHTGSTSTSYSGKSRRGFVVASSNSGGFDAISAAVSLTYTCDSNMIEASVVFCAYASYISSGANVPSSLDCDTFSLPLCSIGDTINAVYSYYDPNGARSFVMFLTADYVPLEPVQYVFATNVYDRSASNLNHLMVLEGAYTTTEPISKTIDVDVSDAAQTIRVVESSETFSVAFVQTPDTYCFGRGGMYMVSKPTDEIRIIPPCMVVLRHWSLAADLTYSKYSDFKLTASAFVHTEYLNFHPYGLRHFTTYENELVITIQSLNNGSVLSRPQLILTQNGDFKAFSPEADFLWHVQSGTTNNIAFYDNDRGLYLCEGMDYLTYPTYPMSSCQWLIKKDPEAKFVPVVYMGYQHTMYSLPIANRVGVTSGTELYVLDLESADYVHEILGVSLVLNSNVAVSSTAEDNIYNYTAFVLASDGFLYEFDTIPTGKKSTSFRIRSNSASQDVDYYNIKPVYGRQLQKLIENEITEELGIDDKFYFGFAKEGYNMEMLRVGLQGWESEIVGFIHMIATPNLIEIIFSFNGIPNTLAPAIFPILSVTPSNYAANDTHVFIFAELIDFGSNTLDTNYTTRDSLFALSATVYDSSTDRSTSAIYPLALETYHFREIVRRMYTEQVTFTYDDTTEANQMIARYYGTMLSDMFRYMITTAYAIPRYAAFINDPRAILEQLPPNMAYLSTDVNYKLNMSNYADDSLQYVLSSKVPTNTGGHFATLKPSYHPKVHNEVIVLTGIHSRNFEYDKDTYFYTGEHCRIGAEFSSDNRDLAVCIPSAYGMGYNSNETEVIICKEGELCVAGATKPVSPTDFPPGSTTPSKFINLAAEGTNDAESVLTDLLAKIVVDNFVIFGGVLLGFALLVLISRSLQSSLRGFDYITDETDDNGNKERFAFAGFLTVIFAALCFILIGYSIIYVLSYDKEEARIFDSDYDFGGNTFRDCRINHQAGVKGMLDKPLGELIMKLNVSTEYCRDWFNAMTSKFFLNGCYIRDPENPATLLSCNDVVGSALAQKIKPEMDELSDDDNTSGTCSIDIGKAMTEFLGSATEVLIPNTMEIDITSDAYLPIVSMRVGFSSGGQDSYVDVTSPYGPAIPARGSTTEATIDLWRASVLEKTEEKEHTLPILQISALQNYDIADLNVHGVGLSYQYGRILTHINVSDSIITCTHDQVIPLSGVFFTLFIVLFSLFEMTVVIVHISMGMKKMCGSKQTPMGMPMGGMPMGMPTMMGDASMYADPNAGAYGNMGGMGAEYEMAMMNEANQGPLQSPGGPMGMPPSQGPPPSMGRGGPPQASLGGRGGPPRGGRPGPRGGPPGMSFF